MTQRIEIDSQSKEVRVIVLTPEEVVALETERQDRKQREDKELKKQAKQLLVRSLAELREMKQNKDIFDDQDIAEKQAEVDRLKAVL